MLRLIRVEKISGGDHASGTTAIASIFRSDIALEHAVFIG
jgi:hypothetical protein